MPLVAKDRRTLRFVIPAQLLHFSNPQVIMWKYRGGLASWHYGPMSTKNWERVAYSSPKALTRSVWRNYYGKGG